MALLSLTPVAGAPGGSAPFNLTAALTAGAIGTNTGITFTNNGHVVVFVQTNSTGPTTVQSDVGSTIEGEPVAAVPGGTQAASTTQMYGPYPRDYNAPAGTVEIDFGTPANITGVVALQIPGVQ